MHGTIKETTYVCEPFGPIYPDMGASVAKYRRAASDGLMTLSKAERVAYADKIEAAILAKQRSALGRAAVSTSCPCASGTWHYYGAEISKAVRQQHRTTLLAYASKVRRERTQEQWEEMYAAAMSAKRADRS